MGIDLKKTAIDLGLVTTNGEPMLAFYRDVIGLKVQGQMSMPGGGTIHHVAFASPDDHHKRWRERMADAHLLPTQVVDRIYFRSIYTREPGGLLVEVATNGPGFAVDEDPEVMGQALVLPPWLEEHRTVIEARLTPIENPRAPR
jgi:glyoxalase family protein